MEDCYSDGISPETAKLSGNFATAVECIEDVQEEESLAAIEKGSGDLSSTTGKRLPDPPVRARGGLPESPDGRGGAAGAAVDAFTDASSGAGVVHCVSEIEPAAHNGTEFVHRDRVLVKDAAEHAGDSPREQMEDCCVENMSPKTPRHCATFTATVEGMQGVQEEGPFVATGRGSDDANSPAGKRQIPNPPLRALGGRAELPDRSGGSAGAVAVGGVGASRGECIERGISEIEPRTGPNAQMSTACVKRDGALFTGAEKPKAGASFGVISPTKRFPARIRCRKCAKKIGPTPIQCRCGGHFCALHIDSWEHACTFNYRKQEAEHIANKNPRIVAPKIVKL